MTKQEAVHAMMQGSKVRHRYFLYNEWMTIEKGMVIFEDGVRCTLIEFWNDRTDKAWETDWELLKTL